jgi:hypothetical protein
MSFLDMVFINLGCLQDDIKTFIEDDFLQRAVNEWDGAFNFARFVKTQGLTFDDIITDAGAMCELVLVVNRHYLDQYGDDHLLEFKKLSPAFVLNHYAYCYAYFELGTDKLLELLPREHSAQYLKVAEELPRLCDAADGLFDSNYFRDVQKNFYVQLHLDIERDEFIHVLKEHSLYQLILIAALGCFYEINREVQNQWELFTEKQETEEIEN